LMAVHGRTQLKPLFSPAKMRILPLALVAFD
jgi:hypothetical protein